jgi:hypothetical protein
MKRQPHKFDYDTAYQMMKDDPKNNFYSIEYDAIATFLEQ